MRINLRGFNGAMSEHFLHGAQVGTAFEQVRGKGMAKRMRTNTKIE
jgi:hypothetical protein